MSVGLQVFLGVVDEHAGRDMHGVDEAQALLHFAFTHERCHRVRDVHKPAPAGHFKPQLFSERFHTFLNLNLKTIYVVI